MQHFIQADKLSLYLLNINHAKGGSKAKFFLGRGFSPERPDQLAGALLRHPLQATLTMRSPHQEGHKLVYECATAAADGSGPCIRSIWIEARDGRSCRLVSAYPFR
jgi:hypothetical protein